MLKKMLLSATLYAVLTFSALSQDAVSPQEWTLATELGGGYVYALAAGPGGQAWAAPEDLGSLGRIFRCDGESWSLQTLVFPLDHGQFFGAFALDGEHVWMGSDISRSSPRRGTSEGGIFFSNGSSWSQLTILPNGISSLYASGQNLWAGGHSALLWHSPDGGASWSPDTLPEIENLSSLSGTDPQHLWAVGMGMGTTYWLLHFNGSFWAVQTGPCEYLNPVSAENPSSVWAGGKGVFHYDGSSWTLSTNLQNVSAIAARDGLVWAGTQTGSIFHYEGTGWTLQTSTGDLICYLDASRPGHVWAGGNNGRVYHLSWRAGRRYHTDYDGDGTSDIGIFRAANGLWAIRNVTRIYFGSSLDQAVPADYSGDGTTDIGIYRGPTGLWAIRGLTRVYFGQVGDIPKPLDYSGEGTADAGVFRPATGLWSIRGATRFYWGTGGDQPAPGWYQPGPGADAGVFRPATGLWSIRGVTRFFHGSSGDTARPGDYTGDGTFQAGIFRPATGLWSVRGVTRFYWGSGVDSPVPADYEGSGTDQTGIYRFRSGLWSVRGVTRVYFGSSSDMPVTR